MADRLLRVLLEIVPKSSNAFQKALGTSASGGTGRDAVKNLEQITGKFSDMHKEIAKLNLAMRPDLIAKRAALEVKLASATEQHEKQLQKAIDREKFGGGVKGWLAKLPGGAKGMQLGELLGLGKGGSQMLGAAAGGLGAAAGIGGGVLAAGLAAAGVRSPATMERFERAMLDVTATFGDAFVPVLDLATDGLRLFGDFLKTIMPNQAEVRAAIAPLFDALRELRESLGPSAQLIRGIVRSGLEELAKAAKGAADTLKLIQQAREYTKYAEPTYWLQKAGIIKGGGLDSSRGMAPTTAGYIGGEELGRAAYASAFAAGATSDAAKTADNTQRTANAAENIATFLKAWTLNPAFGVAAQAIKAAKEGI